MRWRESRFPGRPVASGGPGRRPGAVPALAALGLAAVLCGCGAGATLVGIGIAISGSDGGSSRGLPTAVESANFIDANDNGLVDRGDFVTIGFTGKISLQGAPDADTVFVLDPSGGTFGSGAVVLLDPTERLVTIVLQDGVTLQPNGEHGADLGSSGLDVDALQTEITTAAGTPVNPSPSPIDIEGEAAPRILSATLVDGWNGCGAGQTDRVEIVFTSNVSLTTADPNAAFGLPVSGDSFDTDSTFLSGTPTDTRIVYVVLGTNPVLTETGVFDPSITNPGSPTGLEPSPTPGLVVDAAFPAISAAPGGVDLETRPGPVWSDKGDPGGGDLYGQSASPVFDVDGDLFSDIIVGSPGSTADTGRVHLYGEGAGFPGGPPLTPLSDTQGEVQGGAQFGFSAGAAGNVNLDPYQDIIVGAPEFTAVLSGQGKAYVYLGTAAIGGPFVTAVWSDTGDNFEANYGWSVATAGDVDGDFYSDIIVGAPGAGSPSILPGRAYLYLGSPSGPSPTEDWTSTGDGAARARFGHSVASAGDVNGDGFDDVIVGAPSHDPAASVTGKAYLYLGGPGGLSASAAWTSTGDDQVGARYGASLASLGDINADGRSEFVVGAPMFDTANSVDAGRVYLYFGGPSGPTASPGWTSSGNDEAGAEFGASLGSAFDGNGDGFGDLLVGAPGPGPAGTRPGEVFLYLGSPGGPTLLHSWTAGTDEQPGARFGASLGAVGDIVNGDSIMEVIVGAPGYGSTPTDVGKAYVFQICIP